MVAGLLLVAGCATTAYVYQPAVQSGASANGYPAAYFPIPTNHPTGDVRVASFGVTELQTGQGPETRVLHVRMIVANNQDDVAWSLDTREIAIALGGGGTIRPAFVNTDQGSGAPIVQVPRGEKAVVDLYYPLPPSMASADRLPSFDVLWQVTTGAGVVAQRTPFEREAVEPEYAWGYPYYGYPYFGYGFSVGLGPYWWYDGGYPYYGFHPHPGYFGGPGYVPYYGGVHVGPPGGVHRATPYGYGGSGHVEPRPMPPSGAPHGGPPPGGVHPASPPGGHR